MPTVTPVLSEYISLNDMESTSNRIALFYIQFSPQAVRLARLRGEKRSVNPLIINTLQRQTLVFRTMRQ